MKKFLKYLGLFFIITILLSILKIEIRVLFGATYFYNPAIILLVDFILIFYIYYFFLKKNHMTGIKIMIISILFTFMSFYISTYFVQKYPTQIGADTASPEFMSPPSIHA